MPVTWNRATIAGAAAIVLLGGLAAVAVVRGNGQSRTAAGSGPALEAQDPELLLPQRTKGSPDAPITIYEISDFQCPYCRQFWEETLPILEQEYIATGKARLIFVNFPIFQSHPNAPAAHEFAMCAAHQDRFWPVHDLLYKHQAAWARMEDPAPFFSLLADSANLSRERLSECLTAGRARMLVRAEYEAAWRGGVTSTPSFVIQGALLVGAAPIEQWRPILDSIYAERTGR
ncbi:MAG: DSBA oxidoreductase [Gemmatimonadales bacterium]|nr:Disulfide bond formation protein D [bacterium HR33]GIW51820.1 MAG: DSBA oxidoreductase [Gemmatimonadales bacterium]